MVAATVGVPHLRSAEERMRTKQVDERPRTWVLIFNTGDELAAGLKQFAQSQKLAGSSFKAIGALELETVSTGGGR